MYLLSIIMELEVKTVSDIQFDYFYGGESEQFSFYRIPRRLILADCFKRVSTDAKLLYGLMLDRMSLSAKNGWFDEQGRVYIYFQLSEIQADMNCGHDKAIKILGELDSKKGIGLIERVKQGQGKPARIYVKQFISRTVSTGRSPDLGNAEPQTSEKPKSRLPERRSADFGESEGSYIEINHTELNQLDPSTDLAKQLRENIDYDFLRLRLTMDEMEQVDELVEIMADAASATTSTVKIGGQEIPTANVRHRFLMLNAIHIEYVMDCFRQNQTQIHNIHAYLLTALYRAPTTINHFYDAAVRYDANNTG